MNLEEDEEEVKQGRMNGGGRGTRRGGGENEREGTFSPKEKECELKKKLLLRKKAWS